MLKTASKLIHNWRCYPSSKCCKIDQKHGSELGVLLWCHLTPQKNKSNVGAHLTLSGVQSYCGKFASCMTFDVHKRVCSEPFLDYLHEVWHLLLALCSDVWKFFFHIYLLGPKPLQWNFINIFLLSIQSVAHNFSVDFSTSPFLIAILQKLWRHVLCPKPLQWNFIKIFLLAKWSGAHKLFSWFFDFSQFLIGILRKLWHHLVTKMRTI